MELRLPAEALAQDIIKNYELRITEDKLRLPAEALA